MNVTAFAAAGFALISVGTASASDRVTDVQYLQANRCRALAASEMLGPRDTSSIDAFLKAEGRARPAAVLNMAQDAQNRARRQAQSVDRKARLEAELNGACVAYLNPAGAVGRP